MKVLMQKIQEYKTAINAVLQIILIVIGAMGLSTWREQVRGLDKYNVARDGLVAIYELRDTLALVKTGGHNVEETALRGGVVFDSEGEPQYPDKGHWTDSAFASRLAKLRSSLDRYYENIAKIEVVLGEKFRDDLNTLQFIPEYYYNLGIALYEDGCHPYKIDNQIDPSQSEKKSCISGLQEFNDDEFVNLFYPRFDKIDKALRAILS